MCGIHAVISRSSDIEIEPVLASRLRARGPDHVGTVRAQIQQDPGLLTLQLTSTVLSLRGDHVARQPLLDEESGSILCWNGEIWRLDGRTLEGNDTEALFRSLLDASAQRQPDSMDGAHDPVLQALRLVEGPFAFIYLDKPAGRLYTGRDRLGRRSLLIKPGMPLVLSSVAESSSEGWIEVEADGCYTVQLDQCHESDALIMSRHDWHDDDQMVSSIGVFNAGSAENPPGIAHDSEPVKKLHQHLIESLSLRTLQIPIPPSATDMDARFAVLFSGGLDCTMLARIASDIVPQAQPIDLINVAFENPRIASQHKAVSRDELYELCPDRVTGRKSFAELANVCPGRTWRFVTVNVPFEETCRHRNEVVALMYPHDTEMDLSIANALYFAARGRGTAITPNQSFPSPYSTTARVLLSGLGADELFGGYSRHGVAFSRGGYAGLADELKLDVGRIGKRNLGRDDRVMAQWGKEIRFPFLDERLMKWAIELPAWEKCDFHTTASPGGLDAEKRILRMLATSLGMPSVAGEKKRAIQFGARTAKMVSGKVKGTTSISRDETLQ